MWRATVVHNQVPIGSPRSKCPYVVCPAAARPVARAPRDPALPHVTPRYDPLPRRFVLVTGGFTGFGEEMARAFDAEREKMHAESGDAAPRPTSVYQILPGETAPHPRTLMRNGHRNRAN